MRIPRCGNIFYDLPKIKEKEVFQPLFKDKKLKVERIVSMGQATKEGRWLRQKRNEWVLLLRGKAVLKFFGTEGLLKLKSGDYVFIPKNLRHRVEGSDPKKKSLWLALHF